MSEVPVSLERFAEIQADLAAGEPQADVLARARLDAATFESARDHWMDALGREARRGRSALCARYAAAFLARRPELARDPDEDPSPPALAPPEAAPAPLARPSPPVAAAAHAPAAPEVPSFLKQARAAPAGSPAPEVAVAPAAPSVSGSTAFGVVMPIPGRSLPFAPATTASAAPAAAPPEPKPAVPSPLSGSTAFGVVMPIPGRALPFDKGSPGPSEPAEAGPPAPSPPRPSPEVSGSTAFGVVMPIPGRALPFEKGAPTGGMPAALAALPRESVQGPASVRAPATPSPAAAPAAPPAPPAGGTAMAFELPAHLRQATPFEKPKAPAAPPPPKAPPPPPSSPGELSIERYAALGVELSVTPPAHVDAALARAGVTREQWERVHRTYAARLQQEPDLRAAFEAALARARTR